MQCRPIATVNTRSMVFFVRAFSTETFLIQGFSTLNNVCQVVVCHLFGRMHLRNLKTH